MKRVTGIGGIFLKARNPEKLYVWYERHLGIKRAAHGQWVSFNWRDDGDPEGVTAFAFFPRTTKYFAPSRANWMLNFRVGDLDGLLRQLRRAKVKILPKREDCDYGKFAWIVDPEGNKIELWEPPRKRKK